MGLRFRRPFPVSEYKRQDPLGTPSPVSTFPEPDLHNYVSSGGTLLFVKECSLLESVSLSSQGPPVYPVTEN